MTVPCVPAPPSCWTWLFFSYSSQNGKKRAAPSTSTGSYTTAENRVKNSGTYGLNFPQLTQECNKSGPWRKAAIQPQHSEHLKESSPPQTPRDFLPCSSPLSLSSSKGSHPAQGAGTRALSPAGLVGGDGGFPISSHHCLPAEKHCASNLTDWAECLLITSFIPPLIQLVFLSTVGNGVGM